MDYFHGYEHWNSAAAESGKHQEVFRYSFFSASGSFFVVNGDDNRKSTYYNEKA